MVELVWLETVKSTNHHEIRKLKTGKRRAAKTNKKGYVFLYTPLACRYSLPYPKNTPPRYSTAGLLSVGVFNYLYCSF